MPWAVGIIQMQVGWWGAKRVRRKEEGFAVVFFSLLTSSSVLSLVKSSPVSLSPGLTAPSSQCYPSFYHFLHSFVYLLIYSSIYALTECLVCIKPMASAGIPFYKVLLRSLYRVFFSNMLFFHGFA